MQGVPKKLDRLLLSGFHTQLGTTFFISRETINSRNNFTGRTRLPLRDKSSKPGELKARTAT